jgi:hypothetical protein
MLGTASRKLGITLIASSLLLGACSYVMPAAPTPTPAPAAANGGGRGPRNAQGANAQGGGAGQGAGQGRGAGNGQGGGARGGGQGAAAGGGAGGNGQGGGFQRGATGSGSGAGPGGPAVNGDVDTIDGRVVSVATNTGVRKVEVPDGATILTEGKGTLTDLTPGAMVGVTGKQDGTAIQVRIFGPSVTPRTGQFPMNGANAGNVMTNAKIDSFDGNVLTVDIDGAETKLTVPADAEVVKPVPAAFSDIKSGERILAMGSPDGDMLNAQTVTIQPAQRAAARS